MAPRHTLWAADSVSHQLEEPETVGEDEHLTDEVLQCRESSAGEDHVYTGADVLQIIEGLHSEVDECEKAAESLTSIMGSQPDLILPHVSSLVPTILTLIPTLGNESPRSALIDLLSQLGVNTSTGAEKLQDKRVVGRLVLMLLQSETMDKYSLVGLLEDILERATNPEGANETSEEVETFLVRSLQDRFYTLEPRHGKGEDDELRNSDKAKTGTNGGHAKAIANAIEVFELSLVLSKRYLLSASLKAGALEFLINVSIPPTQSLHETTLIPAEEATDVRIAAISCLAEVYSRVIEDDLAPPGIPSLSLETGDKLKLQGLIMIPLLDIINDEDARVSDKAVEVLYGRINDEDRSIERFFWAHEGSMERLLHKLTLGSPEGPQGQISISEWLLSVLIQRDKVQATSAFSLFWTGDHVGASVKRKLFDNLATTLSNIQEIAKDTFSDNMSDGIKE